VAKSTIFVGQMGLWGARVVQSSWLYCQVCHVVLSNGLAGRPGHQNYMIRNYNTADLGFQERRIHRRKVGNEYLKNLNVHVLAQGRETRASVVEELAVSICKLGTPGHTSVGDCAGEARVCELHPSASGHP
jgi:hypothetical protein